MREIKFRGKTKQGEWVKGSYVYAHKYFGTGEAGHFIMDIYGDNRVLVIPETIGQYTGLKDKNGVEIYEGDIVNIHTETYSYKSEQVGVVSWYDGAFGVSYGTHFLIFSNMSTYVRSKKVIGNIYDNPELI